MIKPPVALPVVVATSLMAMLGPLACSRGLQPDADASAGAGGAAAVGGHAGERGSDDGTAGAGTVAGAGGAPAPGGRGGGGDEPGVVDAGAGAARGDAASPPPREIIDCDGRAICQKFDDIGKGQRPPATLGRVTLNNAAKMFIDDGMAYSGKQALRIEATPIGLNAVTALLHIPVGTIWNRRKAIHMRLMIYPETLAPGGGHWDLLQAHGRVSDPGFGAVVSYGGFGAARAKLLYVGKPLSWADCSIGYFRFLVPKKWTCVEFKIERDHPDHNYAVWMNGAPLNDFMTTTMPARSNCVEGYNGIKDRWYVPDIDTVSVGFHHVHEQESGYSFWIDDLVIDEEPIGCPTRP